MKRTRLGILRVAAILVAAHLAGCGAVETRYARAAAPTTPAPFASSTGPSVEPPPAPGHPRQGASIFQEPYPNISRRFDLSVGGAILDDFDTTVRVFGPGGAGGGFLDLEDLLHVDDSATLLRFDSTYSFNRKHSLVLGYYDLSRSGQADLSEETEVGEVTLPPSAISTEFDTTIAKLGYRFNFVRDTRTVIGASVGVHYMQLDFDIASSSGAALEESFRADLPLPLVGLHSQYALSETWELYSSVEFFRVELGNLRGHLTDVRVGLNHSPFEHFGWGFGYNGFAMDVSFDASDDLDAQVDYRFQGFLVYVRTFF